MPLARRVAASLMLCCAQPCQCFLSQPVANPHSRSVTPNRPTFAQRWQWDFDHTNPALLRTAQVLTFLTVYVKSSSRYTVLCKFLLFGKCSEIVNSFCHFEVHFLLTTFPDRAPQPPKQRPSSGDHGSHFTRKTQGFAPGNVFTREFTSPRTVALPSHLMIGGWQYDVVDTMMEMLTMTIVRNSEVF